ELTSAQASILDVVRAVPRFEVTGSAGTGKTWLAIEQARRWSEAGERVCFVAYGRGVVQYVRNAMSDLPEASRPAFIGTFHQLGETWGAHAPVDDDSGFWDLDAPALMLSGAGTLPPDERFTAFVVDEAQDFADTWWPALLASAASEHFRLAVFRDDEQVVFSDRSGRPDLQLVPLMLSENLRNAHEVVETFRPLISAQIESRAGVGYPVEYIDCEIDQVISHADDVVESLVQERGWLPENVALLTTAHRHPVHAERASDKDSYWADLWSTDDVFYSTVAGFKGLERAVIVLAVDGFHDGVPPRSVMYAGMSRARDLLIVVGPSGILKRAIGDRTMRRLHRGTIPFATQTD
ncbi:MAG: AAA family ATPase, partial [bacterium]|nr:AAA family ATPase [bacterium]